MQNTIYLTLVSVSYRNWSWREDVTYRWFAHTRTSSALRITVQPLQSIRSTKYIYGAITAHEIPINPTLQPQISDFRFQNSEELASWSCLWETLWRAGLAFVTFRTAIGTYLRTRELVHENATPSLTSTHQPSSTRFPPLDFLPTYVFHTYAINTLHSK